MSRALHVPKYGAPLEHAIVRSLVAYLGQHGWKPYVATCGEGDERVRSMRDVLEFVFAVDESAVAFRKLGNNHDVVFIGGNGDCLISDWRYARGDADGFNALMDKFTAALDGCALELVLKFDDSADACGCNGTGKHDGFAASKFCQAGVR
jgi:hypothetical protein